MAPRAQRAPRKSPKVSLAADSIVASPEPQSSPSTASSSYNPTPSPSAPSSSATLPSSPPPSSAPPPTLAKGSQGSSRAVKVNPSNIYQVDDYDGVHEWAEYIASLHYKGDSLFGALRGTVSERYSTIKANTARRERRRYLEEEQIRVLLVVADAIHQDACDACDSDKISPECLRKRDVKLVKDGQREFRRHREFFRPDDLSKHVLEVGFSQARFQGDVEVKSILNLNYLYPYMNYEPGEYLMQLMPFDEATDRQQAIGVRMQPHSSSDSYSMFLGMNDDILIAVAILGFKPRATDFVPRTLHALFDASSAPVEGWDDLVTAWDIKFQLVSDLPKFIQFSVAEARTKLSEAAWLIRRLREPDGTTDYSWKREAQLSTMEQLLCRMTQMKFDDLADQYLKRLGAEALECLKDGDKDKVLVYSSGSWPKDTFKGTCHYYM
ncbi:hypothetical protein PG988_000290 [Apiospora saccharicola]